MIGPGIRLYTDEDVDPEVTIQLRRKGYDALSCHEAGNARRRLSDEWQLTFAAQQERAILTHNIADYILLDRRWKTLGRQHWGIIVGDQALGMSDLIRRIQRHLDTISSEIQRDLVLYL